MKTNSREMLDPDMLLEENNILEDLIRNIIKELGEDCNREGLVKTPDRVAKSLKFLTSGYDVDITRIINGAIFNEATEDIIVVKDIDIYSLCEHHMLPMYGKAHVAYLPNNKIIGLSKIPRICDAFSRRLQVQERLTKQIAQAIDTYLQPKGVIVVIEAMHMCMQMRGVQKSNSTSITESATGIFQNSEYKDRFYKLIRS